MSFAEKLRKLRLEHHMTQEAVAKRLNLARSTIAGYETKDRQPCQENLAAIANLFQVTVDYLINDDTISIDNSPCAFQSDEEMLLITRYRNLSPDSRKLLMEIIRRFEQAQNSQSNQRQP